MRDVESPKTIFTGACWAGGCGACMAGGGRHVITKNHFLHFPALDWADPKTFQGLQLTAAPLN